MGLGTGYTFRGYIINPAIGDVHYIEPAPTPTKSVDELANEVIAGKYGNGEDRKHTLGLKYAEVQARVNEILSSNNSAPQATVDLLELVKKTIRGDFGNGDTRRQALQGNYDEVQRQVNLNFENGTTQWDNIKIY